MNPRTIASILGKFLRIYTLMLVTPIPVGLLYGEPIFSLKPFIYAALASTLAGEALIRLGKYREPGVREALVTTLMGWGLATVLGAIPLMAEFTVINATFEAASGLTTTGISMALNPETLPHSLLFWRALTQWVGGIGVLTFFIAVIREGGGISRKLFSAESNKTDPGSIRPTLRNSVIELWKIYGAITAAMIGLLVVLGMTPFDAVAHSFSGVSTGGFSTHPDNMAAFSGLIQASAAVFMLIGGMNFVLIHGVLRGNSSLLSNSEFRTYSSIFLVLSLFFLLDLGLNPGNAMDAVFQAATLTSTGGFTTTSLTAFSTAIEFVILGVMFTGASLGSTGGGVKVFRVKAMYEQTRTRLRSYSLPSSAINKPTLDGEILERGTVATIASIFFSWLVFAFAGTAVVLFLEPLAPTQALSGMLSSLGNVGPTLISQETITGLGPVTKLVWILGMIAGRLEMLPVLAVLNTKTFKP